ncbi:MAG: NAD-dependent epimerase/dehydratase family protein [Burkholderiales bacterium]
MRVVITGASGFIGRALCAAVQRAGHEAVGLDLRRTDFIPGDVVVHLAATAHRRAAPSQLERVNVGLTRQVGQAAAAHGARLVYLSSVKVHGETSAEPFTERSPIAPRDAYGESKARAEDALRAIPGLRLAVLRPPLVYGPGVKANFLALMRAISRGVPLPFASVKNRRSLLYLGNLVDAILRCLEREGTFLVCDGPGRSTAQWCEALGQALGKPARLFPFPAGLLPRKLAGSLEVDDSALRSELGWRAPFTPEEGLRETARWYKGF